MRRDDPPPPYSPSLDLGPDVGSLPPVLPLDRTAVPAIQFALAGLPTPSADVGLGQQHAAAARAAEPGRPPGSV